jgi:hypothetical protein
VVWGLWGAVGGLFRPLSTPTAWVTGTVTCVPLGVVSGLLLNLIGWTGERGAEVGLFLPGLPPWESLQRLWDYTVDTSLAYDLTRGVTCAIAMALVGGPVLWSLRRVYDPRTLPADVTERPAAGVSARALARRDRSRKLDMLWTTVQGDPDD